MEKKKNVYDRKGSKKQGTGNSPHSRPSFFLKSAPVVYTVYTVHVCTQESNARARAIQTARQQDVRSSAIKSIANKRKLTPKPTTKTRRIKLQVMLPAAVCPSVRLSYDTASSVLCCN